MGGVHSSNRVWWLLVWAAVLAQPLTLGWAAEECADAAPGCRRVRGQRLLLCADELPPKYQTGSHKTANLTLCRWPFAEFDPEKVLSIFPLLKRFILSNSNVSSLASDFPPLENLQEVDMSGLQLESLAATTLARLPDLRLLDLRNNSLRTVDAATLAAPPSLQRVLLAGNPWDCGERTNDWLAAAGAAEADASRGDRPEAEVRLAAGRVADADELICRDEEFNRRALVPVARYRQAMDAGCPVAANCTCSLRVVPSAPGGPVYLIPVVTVDCAGRGLHELPAVLPPNATILHAEDNLISDLHPLLTNPNYTSVRDLYLDGNRVVSVAALEGASWLLHFRLLSLRANRLDRLPTYALESALHRNHNATRLYLGDNPWHCDCHTTPSFQEFLVKYHKLVQDADEIKCSLEEGSVEVRMQDVSRSLLCRDHHTYYVDPLDLLNGVLASLILLILGKLAYDYYHFKKTGKLPWIVTKMP